MAAGVRHLTSLRRKGVLLSFLLWVGLPVAVAAGYLHLRAADQYASTVGFSVRKEQAASPVEFLGGIADFGATGASDGEVLNAFIRSQEMVERLERRLSLSTLYARPADDVVFTFRPGGSVEDLHAYWGRMTRVVHDTTTGLIEVRALAFDPGDAQAITRAVLEESARLVDALSDVAQQDAMEFARAELGRAVDRLKDARAQVTDFRSRTQIVDPAADVQGQMTLLGQLEQLLVEAFISADLLRENTRAGDIRLNQADRRIAVIQARIDGERAKLGQGKHGPGKAGYAMLVAEYERLEVDREFAEQAYVAALAAFEQAQAEARRKSRYLAAHIKPTLAETAQFPRRLEMLGVVAFFLIALWSIAVLVYFSLRDRR